MTDVLLLQSQRAWPEAVSGFFSMGERARECGRKSHIVEAQAGASSTCPW